MSLTVEKCLQAWTNSLRQMNAKADIVFFGDSLTYYGDFSAVFPDKVVCNLGLRGDTILGMIDRVEQVTLLEPKVIFLMAGINDVAPFSIDLFRIHYRTLVQRLCAELKQSKLIIQTLLPVNNCFPISCDNEQIISCNQIIVSVATEYRIHLIDLHKLYIRDGQLPQDLTKDGIHLKEEAYKKWYESIRF